MSAHPVEQAIRAEIGAKCYDDEPVGMALLAVLDLHKPTPDTSYLDGRLVCNGCGLTSDEDQWPYPCDTVKAVADALGVTPC